MLWRSLIQKIAVSQKHQDSTKHTSSQQPHTCRVQRAPYLSCGLCGTAQTLLAPSTAGPHQLVGQNSKPQPQLLSDTSVLLTPEFLLVSKPEIRARKWPPLLWKHCADSGVGGRGLRGQRSCRGRVWNEMEAEMEAVMTDLTGITSRDKLFP